MDGILMAPHRHGWKLDYTTQAWVAVRWHYTGMGGSLMAPHMHGWKLDGTTQAWLAV